MLVYVAKVATQMQIYVTTLLANRIAICVASPGVYIDAFCVAPCGYINAELCNHLVRTAICYSPGKPKMVTWIAIYETGWLHGC